jgi:ribosomal-protein-alanine N-acetyltransferase
MELDPDRFALRTARLVLALPGARGARRVLDFHLDNREHLEPWEPPRAPGFYSEAFWIDRLERERDDAIAGRTLRLSLFDAAAAGPHGAVLGSVSITNVIRGPLQACALGYNLARRLEGQGFMREAVSAVIDHVWDVMRLHRIEAAYVPANERSGRLLRRLGFVVEGYSRDYLFTGGRWKDHLRTALTNPRFPEPWSGP